MITAVPAAMPVTVPVVDPIEAIPVAEELHVPPTGESLRFVVAPGHTVAVPEMVPGKGLTVTTVVI